MPSDEELASWAQEDDCENLTKICSVFCSLSRDSRRIIAAAIAAAYDLDMNSGKCTNEFLVQVSEKNVEN